MFEVDNVHASHDEGLRSNVEVRALSKRLRLTLAVNLFKRHVLGETHIAGDPQVEEMECSNVGGHLLELIDRRTWVSWFDALTPIPKRKTMRALDVVAKQISCVPLVASDSSGRLPAEFFEDLVHGGILTIIESARSSKRPRATLVEALTQYQPLSAWHLHMDAIEVASIADGVGDLPWTDVKRIAAERLMGELNLLWGPRSGAIYKMFPSDLQRQWNSLPDDGFILEERRVGSASAALLLQMMRESPVPDWSQIGVDIDTHAMQVHKVLLAIAADSQFLVAERQYAWAFDLATSALAMFALAWSDRYATFGFHATSEQAYWGVFLATFFKQQSSSDDIADHISDALVGFDLSMLGTIMQTISGARASYINEISELGLSIHDLVRVARHATDVHPVAFVASALNPPSA